MEISIRTEVVLGLAPPWTGGGGLLFARRRVGEYCEAEVDLRWVTGYATISTKAKGPRDSRESEEWPRRWEPPRQ
jgi:hypothetical protein